MVVPWSDLPADLLQRIANMLVVNFSDYVRFRTVCVSWRSSTVDPQHLKPPLPRQFPWALDNNGRSDIVTFLRLSDCKTFHMSVPETRGDRRIVDCTDGWLAVLDFTVPAVSLVLVNPLTRAQIHLPPLALTGRIKHGVVNVKCGRFSMTLSVGGIHHLLVRKVVFSEDHTVIMVYIGLINMLAFVSPGDKQWTMINPPHVGFGRLLPCDILHHKGNFYVVDFEGRLAICNLVPPASATLVASVAGGESTFEHWYLASYGEELLLIAPSYYQSYPCQRIRKFQVFRLDSSSSSSKSMILLEEVKSLGDRILFLGTNQSLCLSARDCPPGYKLPNSIYVTGNYYDGPCEFGFYNLDNGCFYLKRLEQQFKPSMWFTPTLC